MVCEMRDHLGIKKLNACLMLWEIFLLVWNFRGRGYPPRFCLWSGYSKFSQSWFNCRTTDSKITPLKTIPLECNTARLYKCTLENDLIAMNFVVNKILKVPSKIDVCCVQYKGRGFAKSGITAIKSANCNCYFAQPHPANMRDEILRTYLICDETDFS